MATVPTDPERFDALYRAHYGAIVRFVRRRAGESVADDVVAETFAIAWRRIRDVPADPLPWLYVVARNVLLAEHRASGRRRERVQRLEHDARGVADETDPGDLLADQDVAITAFRRLSEADREVLSLVAWERLDHATAARVLGTSRVAFSMRLTRARRRLTAIVSALEDPAAQRPRSRPIQGEQR